MDIIIVRESYLQKLRLLKDQKPEKSNCNFPKPSGQLSKISFNHGL
jgi:hypothetical protein